MAPVVGLGVSSGVSRMTSMHVQVEYWRSKQESLSADGLGPAVMINCLKRGCADSFPQLTIEKGVWHCGQWAGDPSNES